MSTTPSFSSCWDSVVRAQSIPADTAPYLRGDTQNQLCWLFSYFCVIALMTAYIGLISCMSLYRLNTATTNKLLTLCIVTAGFWTTVLVLFVFFKTANTTRSFCSNLSSKMLPGLKVNFAFLFIQL